MTLTDDNLAELIERLNEAERRAVEDALRGDRTAAEGAILRWARRRLKRKARGPIRPAGPKKVKKQ